MLVGSPSARLDRPANVTVAISPGFAAEIVILGYDLKGRTGLEGGHLVMYDDTKE
jgi:hypothetical protein